MPLLDSLVAELDAMISDGAHASELLSKILSAFGAQTGTIYHFDGTTGGLKLFAQIGIPAALLDRINEIPLGKGIAGVAALERRPVTICNLQSDNSGVARPGAKLTGMEGALAVPMLADGKLRGVLGVAKSTAYEWSGAEIGGLERIATLLCGAIRQGLILA